MTLLLAASALALSSPGEQHAHDHGPQLGKVAFETSCTAEAGTLVNQGLGWLHSFEYDQAARIFSTAAAADPACAIASSRWARPVGGAGALLFVRVGPKCQDFVVDETHMFSPVCRV